MTDWPIDCSTCRDVNEDLQTLKGNIVSQITSVLHPVPKPGNRKNISSSTKCIFVSHHRYLKGAIVSFFLFANEMKSHMYEKGQSARQNVNQ